MNYEKLYYDLFDAITETIEKLLLVQINVEKEYLKMRGEEKRKSIDCEKKKD